MAKVKCPKCLTVNPDGQVNCMQCQAPLPRIRIEATPPPPGGGSGSPTAFRPGQTIAERYSVINLIGRGGMGCIYKVFDNTLQEEVALKTLLPQFVRDKMVVERFFNEARIARRMAHPNVVRVHDIGSAEDTVYISMEFLQGQSLRQMLDRLPAGKRMHLKTALHIFKGLCDALEYAHQYTVHRDIKPENVMIAPDGTVKLMDFGISKLMADARMTGASVVMGTPFYMSPEQLRNSRDVDARADIYSMGVMLYEVLTGNVPTGVPKPASEMVKELPPALDQIVHKCVEADPANRYQSADELREALRPIGEYVDSGKDFRTLAKRRGGSGMLANRRRLAGIALLLMLAVGAVVGMQAAENRRAAMAEEMDGAELAAAGGEGEGSDGFDGMGRVIRSLAERSEAAVQERASLRGTFDAGATLWEQAQAALDAGTVEQAMGLARSALQHYAVALMYRRTENMVFIPPGEVMGANGPVYVPGFFIDETEVSYGDFGRFNQDVPGNWRESFEAVGEAYERYPVVNITYYDAQAYAAHYGKRIPTLAQWQRAALGSGAEPAPYPWGEEWDAEGCNCNSDALARVRSYPMDRTEAGVYDMLGNVAEWTRTVANGNDRSPNFGTSLSVAGGHFAANQPTLSQVGQLNFEGYSGRVGFRCVLEIPDTVAGIIALEAAVNS